MRLLGLRELGCRALGLPSGLRLRGGEPLGPVPALRAQRGVRRLLRGREPLARLPVRGREGGGGVRRRRRGLGPQACDRAPVLFAQRGKFGLELGDAGAGGGEGRLGGGAELALRGQVLVEGVREAAGVVRLLLELSDGLLGVVVDLGVEGGVFPAKASPEGVWVGRQRCGGYRAALPFIYTLQFWRGGAGGAQGLGCVGLTPETTTSKPLPQALKRDPSLH